MRLVHTTDSITMAWHIKNILEQHDIICTVKNDKLYSVSGEVPFTECWPEVWVKELDFDRSLRLINESKSKVSANAKDWVCVGCAESNEANFEICWNCQTSVSACAGDAEH